MALAAPMALPLQATGLAQAAMMPVRHAPALMATQDARPSPAAAGRAARPEGVGFSAPLGTGACAVVALAVAGAAKASSGRARAARRGRVAMQARRGRASGCTGIAFKVEHHKVVTATRRSPLWTFSDEMYLNRQIAPDPLSKNFKNIIAIQSKMMERARAQQVKDMYDIMKEVSGFRLQPKYSIADLREGQWVEGRIRALNRSGILVDIGVYTETGEYCDAYLKRDQLYESGMIPTQDLNQLVNLGERVRVRIRSVLPAARRILISMRSVEDLPALFLGKPRRLTSKDLYCGMEIKGIVRQHCGPWAYVDVGIEKLMKIHACKHHRPKDQFGFYSVRRRHQYALTAYPIGAEMDFWVDMDTPKEMCLSGMKTYNYDEAQVGVKRGKGDVDGLAFVEKQKKAEGEDRKKARELSEAEKSPWDPVVGDVSMWLEDAGEVDEEQDSWVMRAEEELFNSRDEQEEATPTVHRARGAPVEAEVVEDDEEEEFADDEFADDDFVDNEYSADDPNQAGFGPNAFSASELDGWEFKDTEGGDLATTEGDDKMTPQQLEQYLDFDGEDEERFYDLSVSNLNRRSKKENDAVWRRRMKIEPEEFAEKREFGRKSE